MGRLRSLLIPGVDKKLLVRDAAKLMPDLARRRFIAGGASLGALTLLTGCNVIDSFSADQMLAQISKFNDAVQALIFNPNALAPTFPESAITKPFPFNAYYEVDDAPEVDGKTWKLEVRGLVDNKKSWTLEELYKLPQVKQVTRHICVEGWSAIGSWTGTPLRDFLKLIGADTRAKYCLVPVRRQGRLQLAARHGDGAASADPDDVQIRRRDPAARLWFSDEDPGADQARLQESEIRDLDGSHQRLQGRLLGRPGLQFVQWELSAPARTQLPTDVARGRRRRPAAVPRRP